MAIQLATNFEVLTGLPIDSRLLMSKTEMLTANDNVMPEYLLTQCTDENGRLYVYSKNNPTPNAVTGKFTPLDSNFGQDIQVTALPVAGSDEVGHVYQYIGETDEDADLIKGCWYICDGNDDDGYAWENILVEPSLSLDEITDEDDPDFIEGSLKTITLKQGKNLIGKFGIDKELVVTEGSVKKITVEQVDPDDESTWIFSIDGTDPVETYTKADTENEESDYYKFPVVASTYIVLGIANQSYPIFIDVKAVVSDNIGVVEEDVTANCAVGAMEIGDIIEEGSSITDVVKKLLIKYYAPTISLSATPTGKVIEIGESVSVNLSAVASKKSENITKVAFYKGTDVLEEITTDVASGGTFTHAVADEIDTTTTFKATVTDGKKTAESKVTYTFVHPYYWGVVDSTADIDVASLTKIVEEKGKKTLTYKANNQYCVFAYDASYADLTSILDPSSFENLGSFEKQTILVGETNYKVYVGKSPLTSTGFEYRFIY